MNRQAAAKEITELVMTRILDRVDLGELEAQFGAITLRHLDDSMIGIALHDDWSGKNGHDDFYAEMRSRLEGGWSPEDCRVSTERSALIDLERIMTEHLACPRCGQVRTVAASLAALGH